MWVHSDLSHSLASLRINEYQSVSISINLHKSVSISINLYKSAWICMNLHESASTRINQHQPTRINRHQSTSSIVNQHRLAPISISINQKEYIIGIKSQNLYRQVSCPSPVYRPVVEHHKKNSYRSEKWLSEGRWYAASCLTPGVTAWCHSINSNAHMLICSSSASARLLIIWYAHMIHICSLLICWKHRKNCECCPLSLLIVRQQRLSRI